MKSIKSQACLRKQVLSIKKWLVLNKLEFIILVLILLVGAFLRLYKISEYMTFLGDEGRDALIVRKLLLGDLVFVGPGTSIGNMYLGPLYYYLMAPALLLANYNPAGPSIMVALLGVATVFLTWYVTREWFPSAYPTGLKQVNWGALLAALLYAVSPVVIILSKHSWNPNIMPFFALLTAYSLWMLWNNRAWKWLLLAGFSFGIAIQSHYLGFLLIPLIVIFWFITATKSFKDKKKRKSALIYTFFSLGFFILLLSPLILFDAKHNWGNLKSMQNFLLERQGSISFNPLHTLEKIYPTWQLLITRLLAGKELWLGKVLSIALLIFAGLIIYKLLKNKLAPKKPYILLIDWLLVGIIGLSLLKGEIYDHYFGFLFPAPFILLGAVLENIQQKAKNIGKIIIFCFLIILLYANLANNPLKSLPGQQMQTTIEVAKKIQEEAHGKRFNFAVIADRNYEGAYQYFLELWNTPIVMINPQRYSDTLADQLFVVCEYSDKTKCQPASNPKAEIANFGWSKIDEKWDVKGLIIFRLVHNWPYK